jgi:hypothetical protein
VDARSARTVASNGRKIAVASNSIALEDPAGSGAVVRIGADACDLSMVALRSDDVSVVRVAADHALASIGPAIAKLRRDWRAVEPSALANRSKGASKQLAESDAFVLWIRLKPCRPHGRVVWRYHTVG